MRPFLFCLCLLLAGCQIMPNYKFVSSGQNVDDALVVAQTLLGNSLKPLAPVNLRGSRNAALDLLIEWTRRERLPLPLRDYAGTPISEENEIYVVEIYSGATLKRTIRNPRVDVAKTLTWAEFYDPSGELTINADHSLSYTAFSDIAVAVSNETFFGDFTLEFTRASDAPPTHLGVAPLSAESPQNFAAGLFASQGFPYYFVQSTGNFRPMGNASYQASSSSGDRFTIQRRGSIVAFYKNAHASSVPVPLYETTFGNDAPLRTFAYFDLGVGARALSPSSARFITNRGYNYTANQQVDDFGSAQSSIKVRVMQESAITGRGFYVERNL